MHRRGTASRSLGHASQASGDLTMNLTRVLAAALCALPAFAADPDFTIAVIPDPQYLEICGSAYSRIFSWITANQAAWNIKIALGVGDTQNTTGHEAVVAAGFGILDTAGIPWASAAGNHDINNGGSIGATRTVEAPFQLGGFLAGDRRATKAQYNAALPGGGGSATWGGYYDSGGSLNYDAQNYWFTATIGARKLILAVLEFHPRSSVLVWLKGVHDAHPGYEFIVTTHSYLVDESAQSMRSVAVSGAGACSTTDTNISSFGPDGYLQGAAPLSNSGCEMWGGSDGTWAGWKSWNDLTMVIGGHALYAVGHNTGPQPPYYISLQPITSTGPRTQSVAQIFTNFQDLDNVAGYCPSGTRDGTTSVGHLTLLKFRPSTGKLEVYALSTNSGLWVSAGPTISHGSTPVLISNVDYPGVPSAIPPSTMVSGPATIRGGVVR